MKLINFGNTDLKVSRISLGTGSLGFAGQSQQSQIPPKEYAQILKYAFEEGINFWDTSDDYGTHPHITEGIKLTGKDKLVIATKIHTYNPKEIEKKIMRCREELNLDCIDVLLLHEIDSIKNFLSFRSILEKLYQAKKSGLIKAVGVSTHSIDILEYLAENPKIEVIFTNFNKAELHMDAGIEDYVKALKTAYNNGKGIYVMKTLAEGKLKHELKESLKFNLSFPFIHSVCVGINNLEELKAIIAVAKKLGEL
ncbi:MAG: aldo/keto reductase [Armatimonadetes bacterium]|nr:aldo/keto reductase [Armatimonadota bacterium]